MPEKHPSKKFPPNKALQDFEPLIGIWSTLGTHGMLPDTMLHGQATFEWQESGAFIIMRASMKEAGFPTGVAIIGSDDALGTWTMMYYDDRGVSRIQQVSLENQVLKWWRDEPGFAQRYSLAISEDHQTIVGKGELCRDGTNWEKDLELTYSRVNH